jgi:hypothetical protein
MSTARVSVSVVDAKANVAYELPVAAISYIELVSTADIDSAGLHRYIVDAAVVADEHLVAFAKNVSSEAFSTDFLSAISLLKGLVDSVETSETFESLLVTIVELYSEAAISDLELLDFAKNLVESVEVPDVFAADYDKPAADEELVANDVYASAIEMPHDEVVSTDGFAGVLGGPGAVFHSTMFNDDVGRERISADVHKVLSDESLMTDLYDRVIEWEKDYSDTQPITEFLATDILKPLGDDEFGLVDLLDREILFDREFDHTVATGDEQALGASTLYEDTVSLGDSFSFEKVAAPPFLFNTYQFNTNRFNATI